MTERRAGGRFDLSDASSTHDDADQIEKKAMDQAAMENSPMGEAHMGHDTPKGPAQKSSVTLPQYAAVPGASVIALIIGMIAPANYVNLRLSAREVGGRIMPLGIRKLLNDIAG
jgi:hypothetical protein